MNIEYYTTFFLTDPPWKPALLPRTGLCFDWDHASFGPVQSRGKTVLSKKRGTWGFHQET